VASKYHSCSSGNLPACKNEEKIMKIIYKYIIKNFAKFFLFITTALVLIGIISDLIDKKEFYTEYKTPLCLIILHLTFNIPCWLMQVLPMSTLLALLFFLGDLSKKNEITAIKAAGINMWQIIILLLTLGLAIGAGDFAVREFIIPKTSSYNETIEKEKIKKEETNTEFSNLILFIPGNTRVIIGYLNTEQGIMKDVILEKYNNKFTVKHIILSEEAVWKNGVWLLKRGVIRNFDSNLWNEIYFKDYSSGISIKPAEMAIQNSPVIYDSMNTFAFKKYINQMKILGQTAVKEKIALNMRYAAVFSHILVMMRGIRLAMELGG
jgi:lipopolysaccharide export system permease protein